MEPPQVALAAPRAQAGAVDPVRVSSNALLWLYAVVPVAVVVPLVDASLLGGAVRRALPATKWRW